MIQNYLNDKHLEYHIMGFVDGRELLAASTVSSFDILFIDILLGEYNGVDIANEIRNSSLSSNCYIYYISAIESYSNKLISTHPVEYLIKPIKPSKLHSVLDTLLSQLYDEPDYLVLNLGQDLFKIRYSQIIYVEGVARKSCIFTSNEKYEPYIKLEELNLKLKSPQFIRIHKSFIINSTYLISYHYETLEMYGGINLPISQSKRKDVRRQIMELIKIE